MIDLIRIKNNDIKLDRSRFGKVYNQSTKKDDSKNYKYKIYRRDLSYTEIEDEYGNIDFEFEEYDDRDYPLALTINSKQGFVIYGSLRKWWFGAKSANADFNYKTFYKCIKLLAKKLNVRENDLWNSKVNKLEIGGNIKLKPSYRAIVGALESYPRRTRFGDRRETVYFKTKSNYDQIIIYDKITQLHSHKKINGNVKRKLLNSVFIMRFEIKLLTPSKTRHASYTNTLLKIKWNWEILIDDWEATFHEITIINQAPPELPEGKTHLTRKDYQAYFIQLGINAFGGIESVEKLIKETAGDSKISQEKAYFRAIANSSNVDEFADFLFVLYTSIEGKANEMKKGFIGVNNIW